MENSSDFTAESPGIFSTAAVLTMLLAVLADSIGLAILLSGLDDCGILDVVSTIIIGGMLFALAPNPQLPKKEASNKVAGAFKKKLKRKLGRKLGLAFLIELIPFLGNIVPSWVIAVYSSFSKKKSV